MGKGVEINMIGDQGVTDQALACVYRIYNTVLSLIEACVPVWGYMYEIRIQMNLFLYIT